MAWPDDVTYGGVTYTRIGDGPDAGKYLHENGKTIIAQEQAAQFNGLNPKPPAVPAFDRTSQIIIRPGDEDKPDSQKRFVTAHSDKNGNLVPDIRIVPLENGKSYETFIFAVPPSQYMQKPAVAAAPVNGTTTVRQDGSVYYTPPFGGQSVLVGQMPADLPNLTFQPEASGDLVGINPQTGAVVTRIAGFAYKQFSPQEVRAQVVSDLANSQRFTASEAAANRTFTGGENAANRAATAAEAAANRAFTGSEAATGRAFTSAENALSAGNAADAASIARAYDVYKTQGSQNFTAGESAIGRALSSGQFAATNALDLADRAAAAKRDTLAAAKTYTELSASPDLTGFQRFMQAGGGNIANAVLGRNDSLTDVGQLGAAQALRVSRAPYVAPEASYSCACICGAQGCGAACWWVAVLRWRGATGKQPIWREPYRVMELLNASAVRCHGSSGSAFAIHWPNRCSVVGEPRRRWHGNGRNKCSATVRPCLRHRPWCDANLPQRRCHSTDGWRHGHRDRSLRLRVAGHDGCAALRAGQPDDGHACAADACDEWWHVAVW